MSVRHGVAAGMVPGALRVGDMVTILTQRPGESDAHWTLGSLESAPYLHDVEVRLWEKQQEGEEGHEHLDEMESAEERELVARNQKVRDEMKRSMRQAAELTDKLRERRKSIMEAIGEADTHVFQSRAAIHAARTDVRDISHCHWHELKSYRSPAKMVLTILRAVMLLLSEDSAKDWPQMQRVLRDPHFKTRILEYDPDIELSRERSDYILRECVRRKSFRYDRAVKGSQAMGPIYYWVLAQLDSSEATVKQHQLEKRKKASQQELREVLREINEQQLRMAEYQALMDKAEEQLQAYRAERQRRSSLLQSSGSKLCPRETADRRYQDSFAGAEKKEYLRAAFYNWKPTTYCVMILRKRILVDFGTVTQEQWAQHSYSLEEPQIRLLDDALQRHQREVKSLSEDEAERQRREQQENEEIEAGLFHAMTETNAEAAAVSVALLERTFDGEAWKSILHNKRLAIVEAFCTDTAEALQISKCDVSVTQLACPPSTSQMVVDAEVRHDGSQSRKALLAIINAFSYPKLQALYSDATVSFAKLHMRFDGKKWKTILAENKEEVEQAFQSDTAVALAIPQTSVEVQNTTATEDALLFDYTVYINKQHTKEAQRTVENYNYPATWDVYRQLQSSAISDNNIWTKRHIEIEGEDWGHVVETRGEDVRRAFVRETAAAVGVEEGRVRSVVLRPGDDGLLVDFELNHPASLAEAAVDARLRGCAYAALWALYEPRPRLEEEKVVTTHELGFEGEDWDYVLEQRGVEVREAAAIETARALGVEREDVVEVELDVVPQNLVVFVTVRHSSRLSEGEVDGLL
ncbi:microtubule-associated protein Gb4, partial [Trypanosoma conorhini]